jgi:acyl carrier protein
VAGEIYLGGAGLARGYLHRADLTAERFVPHPFSRELGARLYRTGDRARYLPDGSINYLGRNDRQIKLRGYRIELGEIEALLSQHQAIDQVVVAIREATNGDKRMIAYVVPKQPQTLTVNEIRSYLKERLPGYMAPSAFVLLHALPLTPNGKVDHQALPAPTASGMDSEREFVAPRPGIEQMLAEIWSQLLGIERLSANYNFFEIGGHSLLAVRLISKIREVFRIELTIRNVFLNPTIAGLAAHMESLRLNGANLQVPAIKPVSREAYRKTISL